MKNFSNFSFLNNRFNIYIDLVNKNVNINKMKCIFSVTTLNTAKNENKFKEKYEKRERKTKFSLFNACCGYTMLNRCQLGCLHSLTITNHIA